MHRLFSFSSVLNKVITYLYFRYLENRKKKKEKKKERKKERKRKRKMMDFPTTNPIEEK
jgi:hypothetical protein